MDGRTPRWPRLSFSFMRDPVGPRSPRCASFSGPAAAGACGVPLRSTAVCTGEGSGGQAIAGITCGLRQADVSPWVCLGFLNCVGFE